MTKECLFKSLYYIIRHFRKEEVLELEFVWRNEHFDAYSKAERTLNLNKKNKTTISAILYVTCMLNFLNEQNDPKIWLNSNRLKSMVMEQGSLLSAADLPRFLTRCLCMNQLRALDFRADFMPRAEWS